MLAFETTDLCRGVRQSQEPQPLDGEGERVNIEQGRREGCRNLSRFGGGGGNGDDGGSGGNSFGMADHAARRL